MASDTPFRTDLDCPRGWDEEFARMAAAGDDQLLDGGLQSSSWGEAEWEWEGLSERA
jgi:hypothetical protein